MSRHRYHFIVPVAEGSLVTAHTPEESAAFPTQEGAKQACTNCFSTLSMWNISCAVYNQWHHDAYPLCILTAYRNDVLAVAAYSAPPSPFDSHAHLLHGVVHANGFGHLARVNGREGGSQQLSGIPAQQMHCWLTSSLLCCRTLCAPRSHVSCPNFLRCQSAHCSLAPLVPKCCICTRELPYQ